MELYENVIESENKEMLSIDIIFFSSNSFFSADFNIIIKLVLQHHYYYKIAMPGKLDFKVYF